MIEEIPGDFLQWLRGFYYVSRQGSVTNAAGVMGRQQPTISRQIKCIERELGITLFDRSLGRMDLTPEGELILSKAVSIFEDVKEIQNISENRNKSFRGKIAISASHSIIDSFLPPYVVNFSKQHPQVKFHLDGALSKSVIEKVDSGEVDLGITYLNSPPETVTPYLLFHTKSILILPKNHSFFEGIDPSLKQIAQCPLILFSRTGEVEPYIANRFASENLNPNVVCTQTSIVSVKKYIELGLGATISVSNAISKGDENNFEIIPIDRFFHDRTYYLFLRRKKYRSPAANAFIRQIKPDIEF